MPQRKRALPSRTKKLIFQEAGSQCAFCDERDVSTLEIHHIVSVENGGTEDPENLILVCSSCHSKITQYVISPADVVLRKRELIYGEFRQKKGHQQGYTVSVGGNVSKSVVANVIRISRNSLPRMNYPAGSIGANIQKKNYLDYLIKRYFDYRKADASFGVTNHAKKFKHSEIHKTIESKFKAKTFFIPEQRFVEVCAYVQFRIERTILGRRNKSRGNRNYCSFNEYLTEQHMNIE
jgi:hypothetical protein